jgi:hypothetical protein
VVDERLVLLEALAARAQLALLQETKQGRANQWSLTTSLS